MHKLKIIIFILIISISFGFLFGRSLWRSISPPLLPPERKVLNSLLYISNKEGLKSDNIFLRKKFIMSHSPINAVIYINAYEDFILFLNEQKIAKSPDLLVLREFNPNESIMKSEKSWHASFQLDISRGREWVYVFDITAMLKKGKNVLALTVKSPNIPPILALECNIRMKNGKCIKITSDSSWKINSLPLRQWTREWIMIKFNDSYWESASLHKLLKNKPDLPKCYLDDNMFIRPFYAPFITHPDFSDKEQFFRYDIYVPPDVIDFWIRLTANNDLDLFFNGNQVINVSSSIENIIDIYDLVQYMLPGKINQLAIRLEGGKQGLPVFLAMDGCILRKNYRPIFFNTGSDWRVSNLVFNNWTQVNDFGYEVTYASIFKLFSLYENTIYTKNYKGVILSKYIPKGLIICIILSSAMLIVINFFSIAWMKFKLKKQDLDRGVFQLIFSYIPSSFFLLLIFIIESKKFLNSMWPIFMYPKFWQITVMLIVFITLFLYCRSIRMIIKN
ncbi:membrane hypothetical protein [Candidatus Magnetomoraceae bacterium gMMP-1]